MRLRHRRLATALLAAAALLVACSESDGSSDEPSGTPPATSGESGTGTGSGTPSGAAAPVPTPAFAGVVAQDLEVPWGLAFLPGGDALVAERNSGRVKRVTPDGKVTTVGTVPGVAARGESGLLGLVASPRFATDHLVYAYFTAASDNRIVRMTYTEDRLGPARNILTGIPKGSRHDGGRMLFGPDGMLYVGTGETGIEPMAQDKNALGGKILRMTPDGKPAPGNPFGDSLVYSYGHRNVQGLAFDSKKRLWASEFGQDTWDELNLIRPGQNYGWPEVEGREGRAGFVDPQAQWRTDDASPSGIAIVDDVVYMAGLKGERLWQIPVRGGQAAEPKAFFDGEYGRLRTVAVAPDGSLWVTTSNRDGRGDPRDGDDKILRIALR